MLGIKGYIYLGMAAAIAAGLVWSHVGAFNAGKRSLLAQLADDRITILKDGKEIDDAVLSSDDNGLFGYLVDGVPDGGAD